MRIIKWLLWLIILLFLLWLLWWLFIRPKKIVTVTNYINWNVVFDPQLSGAQRDSIVHLILTDINSVSSAGPQSVNDSFSMVFGNNIYTGLSANIKQKPYFQLKNATAHFCACRDSLFWNLRADLDIGESGESIPTTTRPKGTGPQGGIVALSNNDSTSQPLSEGSILNPSGKLSYPEGFSFVKNGLISFIDTGIDSTLLNAGLLEGIIPFGRDGSQNVLIGSDPANFGDHNPVRHGTSVTSIALNEFYRNDPNRKLPRMMILKALSDSGRGDLFSMCCAIMLSIQKQATLINISAGYYGDADSVLNHYLRLSRENGIPIIAAAGNFVGNFDSSVCATSVNARGRLGDSTMFYPACASPDTTGFGVIAVTGLKKMDSACYYQNYSDNYVTVGVVNQVVEKNCCVFTLPFFRGSIGLEGSSFATPVVSGRLAHSLINGQRSGSYTDLINRLNVNPLSVPVKQFTRFYIMN